jgi:hypothetical protein
VAAGYVWNIEVEHKTKGPGRKHSDVVHQLMTPLTEKGYVVYVSHDYCSPKLAHAMVAKGTHLVGWMVKQNGGIPQDLISQHIQPGAMDFLRRNDVVVLRWRETKGGCSRDLYVLSTTHKPEMRAISNCGRTKKQPAGETTGTFYNALYKSSLFW